MNPVNTDPSNAGMWYPTQIPGVWNMNATKSANSAFVNGNQMTLAQTSGSFASGDVVRGAGFKRATVIRSQISGVPGGAGVYEIDPSQNVAQTIIAAGPQLLPLSPGIAAGSTAYCADLQGLAQWTGSAWTSIGAQMKRRNFVAKGPNNVQQVMATPPTIAFSGVNPAASGQNYGTTGNLGAFTNAPWTVTRSAKPSIAGASAPDNHYTLFQNVTSQSASVAVQVSVIFSGTVLVLMCKGLVNAIMIKVNDQYVSLTPTTLTATGTDTYISVTFAAAVTGVRVDFIAANVTSNFRFGGMWTGALTDTLEQAPIRGPRVIVLGDSISTATGATSQARGWVQVFSEYMGYDDVTSAGIGGTGLITPLSFQNRVGTDVIPYAPDEVIVQGFYNDTANTLAVIQAAATTLIQTIQAALPACRITFFGPYIPFGPGYQGGNNLTPQAIGYVAVRAAIVNAVAAANSPNVSLIDPGTMPIRNGGTAQVPAGSLFTSTLSAAVAANATAINVTGSAFLICGSVYQFPDGSRFRALATGQTAIAVDRIPNAQPAGTVITQVGVSWITGNGFAGGTTGNGNADLFVISDDVHPTDLGHLHLGLIAAQAYEQLTNAIP